MNVETTQSHDSHVVVVEVSPSNGAGFWGFIFSLLGVTCCAGTCFSWVGLIVSLVGLTKKPRGFAIAGVVLGLVGTFGGMAFWSTVGKPYARIARSVGLMELPTFMAMREAELLVLDEYDDTGALPGTIGEVTDGAIVFVDQWGTDLGYRVSTDGDGYSFHSAGPDALWGTDDEISYTVLDANDAEDFIVSRGTVSVIDSSTPVYSPEQIEDVAVPEVSDPAEDDG